MDSIFEYLPLFFDDNASKEYLLKEKVFYEELECPKCLTSMYRDIKRWSFRCPQKSCKNECTLNKYTFFEGTHLNYNQILLLAYQWLNKRTVSAALAITKFSKPTITKFYSHFRNLISSTLTEQLETIKGPRYYR